jgi:hypothetical protein
MDICFHSQVWLNKPLHTNKTIIISSARTDALRLRPYARMSNSFEMFNNPIGSVAILLPSSTLATADKFTKCAERSGEI